MEMNDSAQSPACGPAADMKILLNDKNGGSGSKKGSVGGQMGPKTPPPAMKPVPHGGGQQAKLGGKKHMIKAALRAKSRFYYMSSDSLAVHGLKDWSGQEWADCFERHPKAAMKFCMLFIGGEAHEFDEPHERLDAARLVKLRMDEALELEAWQQVVRFQNYCSQKEAGRHGNSDYYMEPSLFWNYIFDRDFPLGVEDRLVSEPWTYAVEHSGIRQVGHNPNSKVTMAVYLSVLGILIFAISYMLYLMVGKKSLWTFEGGTLQDQADPLLSTLIKDRTKDRGTVASCLQSLTFSVLVNGMLDKFGKIDPSTSTVFIGMTLGGTFGFIMDNQIGSDEGFREYRWSPGEGMKYAFGALATARYSRYIITIIFDMFFTVILFKILYSKLVRVAGFSTHGREWVANGMVSGFIGIITYQVYANMTRFEWAYPSGVEDVNNQWISGQTMILNVVVMNMVYLVSETRVKVGERGINDPPVKVGVTLLTYCGLFLLQTYNLVDPSILERKNVTSYDDPLDFNLPLGDVCAVKSGYPRGVIVFVCMASLCFGFVIFVTSNQSLTGLRLLVRPNWQPPDEPGKFDFLLGKIVLFFIFSSLTGLIILFFGVVPLYSAGKARDFDTLKDADGNVMAWRDACDSNDVEALKKMGLS